MIKKIFIVLVVLVIALAVVVVLRPDEFKVTRSATIAAPPEVVFEQVNNLQKWNAWSPWAKMDPNAKNTFEGPPSGLGASFAWAGNNKVGEGSMKITESRANERVRFDLEFVKPFKASNITEFTFASQGNQTVVTWTMSGKNNFIGKLFGLIMNCDKMVGGQFEQGLANMKVIAEGAANK